MVMDGGWHYSFMGGTDMILKKMKAYAHAEYMTPDMFSPEWVENQVRSGQDIFKRPMTFKKVDFKAHAPAYVVAHQDRYQKLILT
jgi:beta-1,4-mannosyl-glycoprotein beta-1,4-N-acetylglucosaminyltransferase